MDESKETAFPGHESRQESELNSPSFAFDLIVPPCKIIYASITDSHNSLCALDSRGRSRDKWKLSLWSFRKICLNKKKRKEKIREMLGRLDNGNFHLDFLSFALERWYIYRRFESWMWWMEHGSKIIRSILDFASTFQQIDVQRGTEKELFSYSSLNIPKIKNPFIRTIIDPKKLFLPFRLIPFANIHRANVVSCKKKTIYSISIILISRTNSFINLTIIYNSIFRSWKSNQP